MCPLVPAHRCYSLGRKGRAGPVHESCRLAPALVCDALSVYCLVSPTACKGRAHSLPRFVVIVWWLVMVVCTSDYSSTHVGLTLGLTKETTCGVTSSSPEHPNPPPRQPELLKTCGPCHLSPNTLPLLSPHQTSPSPRSWLRRKNEPVLC